MIDGIRGMRRGVFRFSGCIALVFILGYGTSYAEFRPEPKNPPEWGLYAQAFRALDADAFDRAKTIASYIEDPAARKALTWYRLIEQRRGGSFPDYTQFMEANPHWPWQYTLQYRAEGIMPSDLPTDEVLAFFRNREPASPYGAERYADALLTVGRTAEARALLRETWVTANFPAEDESRFLNRYPKLLDKDLHIKRLEHLLWSGHYASAERQLDRVPRPYRKLAIARIHLARMQSGVDKAIAAVPDFLKDHPGLKFERARWRMRKGRFEDTVALMDPPSANVPYPERWWHTRHWAARTALNKGHISQAYRIAAAHGLESGLGFAQGEWLAGWIALRFLNEPNTAKNHFEALYKGTTTPVSRSRGAYWSGRAASQAGASDEARRWFETAATKLTTFYGQLASAQLGDDMFLALPREPHPKAVARMHFNNRDVVKAIRAMAKLGREDHVGPFIRFLTENASDRVEGRLIADLAQKVGRRDLAVAAARDLRRRSIILPKHLYPEHDMPVGSDVNIAVDQSLILAIARQESNFNTRAISPAGAYGLMQLMPATARQVALSLDIPFNRNRLIADADYNLRLGSSYIGHLIERFDGSLLLAVAAYNAGPSRVYSWLDRFGDPRSELVGPIDWIESIPIAETRNYVQRVLEGYMIYRHRVAPTRIALALHGNHLLAPHIRTNVTVDRQSNVYDAK